MNLVMNQASKPYSIPRLFLFAHINFDVRQTECLCVSFITRRKFMRRSVLLIAIALMLTPACTGKKEDKYKDLSKHGKEMMYVFDKMEKNNKKAIQALKKGKAELSDLKGKTPKQIRESTKKAMVMHELSKSHVAKMEKLLVKAWKLSQKKDKLFTEKDQLATDKRKTALRNRATEIVTLNREFMAALELATTTLNKQISKRMLHRLSQ